MILIKKRCDMIKTAILTVSDKGYSGERNDMTGPAIIKMVENEGYNVEYYKVVPDEYDILVRELTYLCDDLKVELVLTNGGTGFSKRDITPEATEKVIEKNVPGIAEAMRQKSLEITKRAMLSRAVAGIRGDTLIINLPGSPKAAVENLGFVLEVIPHGIDILNGRASECAAK